MYMKRESEVTVKNSIQKNDFITDVSETSDQASVDFVNCSSVPALDTPTITNLVLSTLEGVQSGVPTRTTATLTPTTLRNIEQILETQSLSPPETHSNQAGFVPPPVLSSTSNTANTFIDKRTWGGGIVTLTTVDEPASSNNIVDMPSISIASTKSPPEITQRRSGGRRPANIERLSPEEEDRRTQRRERNKAAAARCRKRRLDQTNLLQDETDDLEYKKSSLQKEIEALQNEKDELEYLLVSHQPSCKRNNRSNSSQALKIDTSDCENSRVSSSENIKHENFDCENVPIEYETSESVLTNKYPPLETIKTTGRKLSCAQRPTSLAVAPLSKGVSDLGVSIETPSNALRGYGLTLDMMECGTGFTPVSNTGLTPVTSNGPMGFSSSNIATLNTPIIGTTHCGSQQRTSSCDSPESAPLKLVSL